MKFKVAFLSFLARSSTELPQEGCHNPKGQSPVLSFAFMPETYTINREYPQPYQIQQIVQKLRQGAVMLYPTDTVMAIGCDVTHKQAVERVRQLKRLSNDKPLTFLCPSLSQIATYAKVSDPAYRLMRKLIPGPYTFLLPATKLVPKLVMDPKRKTTGIRVPHHPLCQALLQELDNPIVSTSAKLGSRDPVPSLALDPQDLEQLGKQVDLIVDDESPYHNELSTVLDLTGASPQLVRQGMGYEQVVEFLDITS